VTDWLGRQEAAVIFWLAFVFYLLQRLTKQFDPPKSPLKRGTLSSVPPFLRGARGNLQNHEQNHQQEVEFLKFYPIVTAIIVAYGIVVASPAHKSSTAFMGVVQLLDCFTTRYS
jgi:hypothetical protein